MMQYPDTNKHRPKKYCAVLGVLLPKRPVAGKRPRAAHSKDLLGGFELAAGLDLLPPPPGVLRILK